MTEKTTIQSKDLTIEGIPAYHAYPDDGARHPALIVIHEIWGLNAHIRDVADRFAREGYSVLAPNLFHGMPFEGKIDQSLSAEMHDPATRDEAQKKMRAILAPIRDPEFAAGTLAELERCMKYLVEDPHVLPESVGVLGFCFGGTYSMALAALDPRVAAAVSFYGHPLKDEQAAKLAAPVLAFYGDKDANLMESLAAFKETMHKHGKRFDAVVYPEVGHAFFNDTNARMYDKASADDAWSKTLAFLAEHLG